MNANLHPKNEPPNQQLFDFLEPYRCSPILLAAGSNNEDFEYHGNEDDYVRSLARKALSDWHKQQEKQEEEVSENKVQRASLMLPFLLILTLLLLYLIF